MRQRKRLDGAQPLAGDPQRLSARDEHLQARGTRQEPGDVRCGSDDLLEVVEHEQDSLFVQKRGQRRFLRDARLLAHAERGCDRAEDEARLTHRRQRDEEDTVGEGIHELGACLQGQPGLAGASRTGERDEARRAVAEQLEECRELGRPSNQPVRLHGQVRDAPGERVQRRELGRQLVGDDLIEPLRRQQILEDVVAERDEADLLGNVTADELGSPRGDEHLAAVAGAHHARGDVHLEARVEAVGLHRLAAVQADACPQRL